ncbi:MerC domain-containing protein [Novosphingobium sp. G106]|nr:MerC domain-containing protein [Novosphingobium sp. G106]
MSRVMLTIRDRFDRVGVVLSGLCALHCVLSIVLVSVLGLGGEILLTPAIHEIGLALAIAVGVVTLGLGVLRHRQAGPLLIGAGGISLMSLALLVPHGPKEAMLTIAGVALVATAHIRNLRHAA